MSIFLVRGISEDGLVQWYTGKAGEAFVGNKGEAFIYHDINSAQRRAVVLNRMTPIHGFHFMVPIDRDAAY